jgi:cobalt-zinc-cadmium efflux system membrane fusion protein
MTGGDEALFEVVDTSSMWAEVDVPEAALALVRSGQPVTIRLRPLGERTFEGTIQSIAPEIDPHTRTARARVPLENPDGVLRANMYGEAQIALEGERSVVVPRSAVQRAKGRDFVFVRQISSEFEARRVKTGARDGEHVVIHEGVRPGEQVVTTGSFLLKTEILAGSIGAGCCE